MFNKNTKSRNLPKEEEVIVRKYHQQEFADMMGALMHTVVSEGEYVQITGEDDKETLKSLMMPGRTFDVQTALATKLVVTALKTGDVKATETIFKYAGFEPVKKIEATVCTPTFVDDVPDDIKLMLEQEERELALANAEKAEDDEIVGDLIEQQCT